MENKQLGRKIVLCEEKMAPWRKGYCKDVLERIAAQVPLPLDAIKEHYFQANAGVVEKVGAAGELRVPKKEEGNRWNYEIAMKQCTDARQVTTDLGMLLRYIMIHERTAGNVVRKGEVFKNLSVFGIGIVEGHYKCGATGVAYKYRDVDAPDIDKNILRILSAISPYVRDIADTAERDRENAVDQANRVRMILRRASMSNKVYPGFFTWENGSGRNYEWLGEEMPDPRFHQLFSETAGRMTDYAYAEGRDFDSQYASITMIYDPFRLGRINDPRAIFDALGNEMFCVTFDLRRLMRDVDGLGDPLPLSRTGMGSVLYANFDQGGHVSGVGGVNGTHAIGILDPDDRVIEKTRAYLLDNFPEIKNLTNNGDSIFSIRYDPASARAVFL